MLRPSRPLDNVSQVTAVLVPQPTGISIYAVVPALYLKTVTNISRARSQNIYLCSNFTCYYGFCDFFIIFFGYVPSKIKHTGLSESQSNQTNLILIRLNQTQLIQNQNRTKLTSLNQS